MSAEVCTWPRAYIDLVLDLPWPIAHGDLAHLSFRSANQKIRPTEPSNPSVKITFLFSDYMFLTLGF